MKVKIGDYNLLESITIIQMHNSPIYCELEDKIEGDVHLEIDFKEDRNEPRPYTNIKAQDNYKLLITIYKIIINCLLLFIIKKTMVETWN